MGNSGSEDLIKFILVLYTIILDHWGNIFEEHQGAFLLFKVDRGTLNAHGLVVVLSWFGDRVAHSWLI